MLHSIKIAHFNTSQRFAAHMIKTTFPLLKGNTVLLYLIVSGSGRLLITNASAENKATIFLKLMPYDKLILFFISLHWTIKI